MKFNIFSKKNNKEEKAFGELASHKRRVSELRRDLVGGAWIVLATARGNRPHEISDHSVSKERSPKKNCPFEDPQASGNGEPLLIYGDKSDWSLQVVANKYPAFSTEGECIEGGKCKVGCGHTIKRGLYSVRDGFGYHEILITRDHDRYLPQFTDEQASEVIKAYLERYNFLKKQDCIKYIAIFENHGKKAGASIYHPHAQIMALPFLPSDIRRSLRGSAKYNSRHKRCVHCVMLSWELERGERVIYEEDSFVALCPFVSFGSFEIRIYPKLHQASFDQITKSQITSFARELRVSLGKLDKALNNPPYNYFIHTAPLEKIGGYSHYHWHLEILPTFDMDGGFELGTGVQITTTAPEEAAKILNKQKP